MTREQIKNKMRNCLSNARRLRNKRKLGKDTRVRPEFWGQVYYDYARQLKTL